MPYKSRAQQRYFQYLESKGRMPKKVVEDFDDASDFDDLPEHVEGYAHGGEVENYDYDMGHAHEYDSSGEPDTEFDFEDEKPMPFMNQGGRVKRMSRGGMVPNPAFIKALRRSR